MSLTEIIATQIRVVMAKKNRSVRQCAAALGCSIGSTDRLVAGEKPMTSDQIELVAQFLGIPPVDLVRPVEGVDA
ncbi:MAG: helix-turn-helix transcriptional regulator [Propionibacteriaceae bacterium]|nr:helix-turn-helix transcriptional regulator [Propionibacteriaceae bacterium]